MVYWNIGWYEIGAGKGQNVNEVQRYYQDVEAKARIQGRFAQLKTLGQALRYFRRLYGMSQKEVAEKMGVPYQQYQKYEYDARTPRRKNRQRLADALDLLPDTVNTLIP